MTIFDLLFIFLFLVSAGTLLTALFLMLGGRGKRAFAILRGWGICAAAYLALVALTSLFWPRTILQLGEPRCYDDWCIAVESATPRSAAGHINYQVTFRLSSTARRVSQRELSLAVYISDGHGRRYAPLPDRSEVPFSVLLAPQQSVLAHRSFDVPTHDPPAGIVIAHEGGFPIGWLIIGDEAWFHKPTLVRI